MDHSDKQTVNIDQTNATIALFDGFKTFNGTAWLKDGVMILELKYHSSWQEIHSVWNKAYTELNKMDFYIAVENSLRGRFIEPMKEAMITGNIQWINKQNDNGK